MTKRDDAVFAEAFKEMEAEGYFNELRAKAEPMPSDVSTAAKAVPEDFKAGRKSSKKTAASVSSLNVAQNVPLAASKK